MVSAQFLLDSESSKSSDFKRMNHGDEMNEGPSSGWTSGTINEVNVAKRVINLSHGRIEAFDMMGMTMNFMVADSVDMGTLKEGMTLELEVSKGDGPMFEITDTKIAEQEMDHSQMDHAAMGSDMDATTDTKSGWTTGTINEVLIDKRQINLSHGAIEEIPMMGMTMNFAVADNIDISTLNEGMNLPVEITLTSDNKFVVTNVAIADPSKWTDAIINSVNVEKITANFTHKAIQNLGMMGMTMDFNLAPSVDISSLKEGSAVQFIVEMPGAGVFEVTHVKSIENE